MTRPIQPQWACLCGFRSDQPGTCCGAPMYVVGIGGTKAEAWGNLQSVILIKGEA